ncbi:autotransporter outer membrane beta-barrel domain-containing protein, partial [Salmonella enterica subsp. enterica serovar Anatum]|nr:autotransporter outer membrane beta-barrel domain-containing protein [Salmonella enterica subsp. enterica serovar Anatum]
LTINEDYVGNGGKLVFNTVLNDDDSETDRLQVLGNTSGNTFVHKYTFMNLIPLGYARLAFLLLVLCMDIFRLNSCGHRRRRNG